MLFLLILLMISFGTQAGEYENLADRIERDYNKMKSEYDGIYKSDCYNWKFAEVGEIPVWCRDDISLGCGETVWVEGRGQIMRKTKKGVCVAVRSWLERKEDRAQVTRLYVYRKDTNGIWQRKSTYKITENWNDDVGWICQR
ncbi:MAG: hypothetical protein GF401_10395 [Chitinivibrionales bacterium]|nr:hypothetical protein [Chitinivibrionales bacterium]